jgi:putative SOS response-associated peptidase YedK
MIRLGGKFENVLVSQVKVLHHWRSAPVIFDADSYDLCLDPGMRDMAAATKLLKPYDARLMRCYPVSTRINRVANDDEESSHPWSLQTLRVG